MYTSSDDVNYRERHQEKNICLCNELSHDDQVII